MEQEKDALNNRLIFGPQYHTFPLQSESFSQSRRPSTSSSDSRCHCISQRFKLHERGSDLGTEIKAGLATFIFMAYIPAVNAAMLSQIGGECKSEDTDICVIQFAISTTIVSAVATLIMGIFANLPLALAPGIGMNAYFVYTVVTKLEYGQALLAILMEGIIFFGLSCLEKWRVFIEKLIPLHLKAAIITGIGFFLAFTGLQNMKISVPSQSTGVTALVFSDLKNEEMILGIIGLLLMISGMIYKKTERYSIIGSIFIITVISCALFPNTRKTISLERGLFSITKTWILGISQPWKEIESGIDWYSLIEAMFVLLCVNLLDTTGALYGMALHGKTGDFTSRAAFCANGIGTIIGAIFGTSPVTVFVESYAGIKAGGKTGITAIVVSLCFFIALWFSPLIVAIPSYATAPVLIVIGTLMTRTIEKIDWNDLRQAFPSFITIVVMNDTYSIALGIFVGIMVNLLIVFLDWLIGKCESEDKNVNIEMEKPSINNTCDIMYITDENNGYISTFDDSSEENKSTQTESDLIRSFQNEIQRFNQTFVLFSDNCGAVENCELETMIQTISQVSDKLQAISDKRETSVGSDDEGSTDCVSV